MEMAVAYPNTVPEAHLVDKHGSVSSIDPNGNSGGLQQSQIKVALLTGGDDKTYALGLTSALVSKGVLVDFIGSSALDSPELHNSPLINFLNLRGDQNEQANISKKVTRILAYYIRLIKYAAVAQPSIFHILWNNKFELIDRIVLMVYYRLMGKKIALTAHNVNAAKRDSRDTLVNRASLRFQYRMADHIFVHTNRMKDELHGDFGIPPGKVSVIPFGINNVFRCTSVTSREAKERLGLSDNEKTALFFGRIAPYKGLEYLLAAIAQQPSQDFRLMIAGKIEPGCTAYWEKIQREIVLAGLQDRIITRIQFIPDNEVELYFKAADVLILPYTSISQSGVPFLAYNFGLPVIATDVGALRDDIIEGKTGFVCAPRNPTDLAQKIQTYFSSDLYRRLKSNRHDIRDFANERYSWTRVGEITQHVYQTLLVEKGLEHSQRCLSE
jgi:glycosyltransferase involved in cell wall biosynthesis